MLMMRRITLTVVALVLTMVATFSTVGCPVVFGVGIASVFQLRQLELLYLFPISGILALVAHVSWIVARRLSNIL